VRRTLCRGAAGSRSAQGSGDGYSFGGYYAARIAAFEKRYAAGVAFSALHWTSPRSSAA